MKIKMYFYFVYLLKLIQIIYMNKLIIFLFIFSFPLFFMLSCDEAVKTDNSNNKVTLSEVDTIHFSIDSLAAENDIAIRYYVDSKSKQAYLVLLDKKNNRLLFYNWATQKLYKTISLEREGPNGVGGALSFHFQSWDSIYVLASYHYRLSLIDTTAKVKRKYRLLKSDMKLDEGRVARPQGDYSALPSSNYMNPLIKVGSLIYLTGVPDLNINSLEYYTKGKIGIQLNLENGEVNYYMNYPQMYRDKYFFPPLYVTKFSSTYIPTKNKIIYSFPIDETLHELDLKTGEINTINPDKSQYFKELSPISKNAERDMNADYLYSVNNVSYERIVYDQYKNIYYRFTKIPNTKKKDEYDNQPHIIHSVLILDENFKKLGETVLNERYTAGYHLCLPDGLYLKKYNFNEDEIALVKFTLKR